MTTPEFEIRPREEMPEVSPRGSKRRGLTDAIRNLNGKDALFVPARDGEDLEATRHRIRALVSANHANLKASTRIDRNRNGVWIYKNEVPA